MKYTLIEPRYPKNASLAHFFFQAKLMAAFAKTYFFPLTLYCTNTNSNKMDAAI